MDLSTTGSVFIKEADERELSDAPTAPKPSLLELAREILRIRHRLGELGCAEIVANPGGYLRALMKRGPDALMRDLESNRALLARVEAERARAAAEAAVGAQPSEKAAYELAWEALPEAERAAWMERGRESAEREGLLATAMAEYGAESPFVHAVVEYHAQQLHRHAHETAQERAAAPAGGHTPPGREKAAHERAWEALPEAERAAWMERGRESAEREGLLATAMAEYGAESPFVHAVVEYHAQQLHRHAPETAQERAAAPAGGRTPPGREKPAYERAWEAPRRFAGEDETSPDAAGAEDRTANPARPPT